MYVWWSLKRFKTHQTNLPVLQTSDDKPEDFMLSGKRNDSALTQLAPDLKGSWPDMGVHVVNVMLKLIEILINKMSTFESWRRNHKVRNQSNVLKIKSTLPDLGHSLQTLPIFHESIVWWWSHQRCQEWIFSACMIPHPMRKLIQIYLRNFEGLLKSKDALCINCFKIYFHTETYKLETIPSLCIE